MKNTFLSKSRRGFTLIETIVTVGLIAVLAAFVVPTVMQKAGVADPVKVQNDLGAVETAIIGFINDTRGARPDSLTQLTLAISSTNKQLEGDFYTAQQADLWKGPYLSRIGAANQTMPTGYGLQVNQALVDYDADQNVAKITVGAATDVQLDGTTGTYDATHQRFIAAQLDGVPVDQAKAINKALDGSEDVTATSTTFQGTGRVRFTAPTNGANSTVHLYYLLVPEIK
jgi:prepilin-type N-terminal cleavage/methylation domain-containing protein